MLFNYLLLPLLMLAASSQVIAADQVTHANLDSSWVVIAGILVFFMQAGFAFLESGMARTKNTVNVLMKNFTDVCVGSIVFLCVGFGLMFGDNPTGWIGQSHFLPFQLPTWDWTFLFFQMMFAATATTIASGAMAERTHFTGYLIGAALITGIVYPVMGSWAWGSFYTGEGWLKHLGFIDFAGSTVVHSIGGWCALAGIWIVGPRLGRFSSNGEARYIPGHNLTMVALGGFILWFAWFGFNAGSTLAATANIGKIALNTHLAACAGAIGAMVFSKLFKRPILLTAIINAALGGLVSITAGCATTDPIFAILIGFIAGIITIIGPLFIVQLRLDDVVDAVSVHGFCGVWGTLAAGMFFSGDLLNIDRIAIQALGAGVAFIWGFGSAVVIYGLIHSTIGLRATSQQEQRGLDVSEHAEIGYPEFQNTALFDTEKLNRDRAS